MILVYIFIIHLPTVSVAVELLTWSNQGNSAIVCQRPSSSLETLEWVLSLEATNTDNMISLASPPPPSNHFGLGFMHICLLFHAFLCVHAVVPPLRDHTLKSYKNCSYERGGLTIEVILYSKYNIWHEKNWSLKRSGLPIEGSLQKGATV